jgi:hypothetical protein
MIYFIGVDHRVQAKAKGAEPSEEQKRFAECLTNAIQAIRPVLVAEEYSLEALRMCQERTKMEHESITEPIARSLGVEHRFCDPDKDARRKMEYREGWQISVGLDPTDLTNQDLNDKGLALEIAKEWPKREQFWLDQIGQQAKDKVLFVIGNGHVATFEQLLRKNGIETKILALRIGVLPNDDDEQRLARAQAYLQAHPELLE